MALSDIQDIPNPGQDRNLLTAWRNWKKIKERFNGIYYTSNYSSFSGLVSDIGTNNAVVVVNSTVTLTADTTVPSNISIRDGGGVFVLGNYNLNIKGPCPWGMRQAFSYTGTGVVEFATGCDFVCSPEHWGGVPDAYTTATDNTAAVQACVTAAATGSRKAFFTGWYRVTGTITIPQRSVIIEGVSADASGIAHDPSTFINCFEGDTLGEGWIRMSNFSLEALHFGLGKTKYFLYYENLNEGSKIDIKINGGVGQIYVGLGYLSDINIRCTNTTCDAVGSAGISQAEWEQVWGTNHAPIHLNSMNACRICIRTFRVCTVVTGGVTGFAPIIIDDSVGFSSEATNIEWGLTNYDTFTNGAGTFAPRSKHALYIESSVGRFTGLNIETMRTTETLVKVTRESSVHIGEINDYYTYCEGDRFLNSSHNDQIVEVYRGYVMRNGGGNLFKTTNSGISASQGWLVRASIISYGGRYRQTIANSGPNDDVENIIDTCEFSGTEKLGITEDASRAYSLDRIVIPKILTGYTVTSGSNPTYTPTVAASSGYYVEITCGVFMRESGQQVALKWYTGSATGNLQRFRLRPVTASKWYRVFVGIGGNPYLIEYGSDPASTPEGNWIASFQTDGSLAITSLANNPRLAYTGVYTPNDTDVQIVASSAPSTGYWRAGSTYKYSAGTNAIVGGKCITAGTPGTWRSISAGALVIGTSTVGNVGVGEDDLMSWSMPANTLLVNDDSIEIDMAGQFANTANNKRLRIYFGSSLVFDTTSLAISAASDWMVNILVIRTGSATQRVRVDFSSTNSVLATSMKYTATSETMSGAITIKATGEATSNNDVTQTMMRAKPVTAGS